MTRHAVFDIAGIRYALKKQSGDVGLEVDAAHARFLTNKSPEFKFQATDEPWPARDDLQPLFESGSWWKMFSAPDARVISFYDTQTPRAENRRGVFAPDYRSGTVYCQHPLERGMPLSYPLEELIFINILPAREGVIIHSCGAGDEQGGFLFVGVSGAGKSTMCKQLMRGTDWTVLSDDRIILRRTADGIRMFGTPWHGEVDVCDNSGLPLRRIYFLKQAPANSATRWSPPQAATALLARCFPPFWDVRGMEQTTQLCIEIASQVPCYELGFVPDPTVVEFMASLRD